MPDEPEAIGLLALMLLQDARREARVGAVGRPDPARGPGPQPLGSRQDRRGRPAGRAGAAVQRDRPVPAPGGDRRGPRRGRRPGRNGLAAGRCAVPDSSPRSPRRRSSSSTWPSRWPSSRDRPSASRRIDDLVAAGELDDYPYLHAARADLLRRLGRRAEAAAAYRRAADLVGNAVERRFLEQRLREVAQPA